MHTPGEIYTPWRIFKGSFIPNAVLKCRELSSTAKLVFARLCQYGGEHGQAYPSYNTLAGEVGVERRQAIRAVNELEAFGLLRRNGRLRCDGGLSSNAYVFLWHSIFSEDDPGPSGSQNDTRASVINDTRGSSVSVTSPSVVNVTSPSVIHDTSLVSFMTPKENHIQENKFEETTTGQTGLLLSGTPLSKISEDELLLLAKRHSPELLRQVADIAAETWRRERKEIRNPAGYLHALCDALVVPAWYQPPEERAARKQAEEEQRAARLRKEQEEQAAVEHEAREKDAWWTNLSAVDQERFRVAVEKNLPPEFRWPAVAITAMAKSLAWEQRSPQRE